MINMLLRVSTGVTKWEKNKDETCRIKWSDPVVSLSQSFFFASLLVHVFLWFCRCLVNTSFCFVIDSLLRCCYFSSSNCLALHCCIVASVLLLTLPNLLYCYNLLCYLSRCHCCSLDWQ